MPCLVEPAIPANYTQFLCLTHSLYLPISRSTYFALLSLCRTISCCLPVLAMFNAFQLSSPIYPHCAYAALNARNKRCIKSFARFANYTQRKKTKPKLSTHKYTQPHTNTHTQNHTRVKAWVRLIYGVEGAFTGHLKRNSLEETRCCKQNTKQAHTQSYKGTHRYTHTNTHTCVSGTTTAHKKLYKMLQSVNLSAGPAKNNRNKKRAQEMYANNKQIPCNEVNKGWGNSSNRISKSVAYFWAPNKILSAKLVALSLSCSATSLCQPINSLGYTQQSSSKGNHENGKKVEISMCIQMYTI